MTSHIYCDMDGVLADFISAAEDFFDMEIARDNTAFNKLWDRPDGWPRLKTEWPTFWMDLDPMPHALQLWKVIAPYHPSILTAIPNGWPSSATGKLVWCKRHLPKFGYNPKQEFHAVQRSEKQHFAKQADGTPNILIDDFQKNINEWQHAGGIGILYVDGSAGVAHVQQVLQRLTK